MEKTLQSSWFRWSEKKLENEGIEIKKIGNYQSDMAPIMYCCIQHKRIAPKGRNIILSEEFKKSKWVNDNAWIDLQRKIEAGVDINGYMSKQVNDWQSIDYLLYTCNITHFHLYKNIKGGIRDELVFGIFTKDHCYVLCIGNHKDIYRADFLVAIASASWPTLDIFKINEVESTERPVFSSKEFKRFANDSKFQFNMINPVMFTDHSGRLREIDNHQNTALINLTLNGVNIGKIPLKVYLAYENEINYLEVLDATLFGIHGVKKMSLCIDEVKGNYLIEIYRQRSLKKIYRIPRKYITCSLYENFKQ